MPATLRRPAAVGRFAAPPQYRRRKTQRHVRSANVLWAAVLVGTLFVLAASAAAAEPFATQPNPAGVGYTPLVPGNVLQAVSASGETQAAIHTAWQPPTNSWETTAAAVPFDRPVLPDPGYRDDAPWTWQLLPDGTLYESYLAGTKESRFQSSFLYSNDNRWLWDVVLGGRVGLVRFGTNRPVSPEGWQLEIDGAAYPRLDMDRSSDVESVDFRFAVPLTYRRGPFAAKFAYNHISSHLGDEFLIRNPGYPRLNYSKDSLRLGLMYWLNVDLRAYSEFGYAFYKSGGAEPWEMQFGLDYSPAYAYGLRGAPFAGVNAHLREEVDFGGGLNLVAGWQWRGRDSDDVFRIGLQYYNGKSTQYSFFNEHEELFGAALWYDY